MIRKTIIQRERSHQSSGASGRLLTVLKRPTGDRIGQAKCHNTVFGVMAATVQSPRALSQSSHLM